MRERFVLHMLSFFIAATALTIAQPVVEEIRVENRGHAELDAGFVRAFLDLHPGSIFNRAAINRAIRNLHRTGRFSLVEAEAEPINDNLVLVFAVESRPVVRRIEIQGAERLGNRRALDLLDLNIGDPVDESVLGNLASELQAQYRKRLYLDSDVEWEIVLHEDGETADVLITVKEGSRGRIRRARFSGNTHLRSKELRKALQQRIYNPWNPWHWVTRAGRVEMGPVIHDRDVIKHLYRNAGFLDIQVSEPELKWISDRRLEVHYHIDEGQRYRLGKSEIKGATQFDLSVLEPLAALPQGEPASYGAITGAARRIREHYSNRGYIFTRVEPRLLPEEDVVDIIFQIEEGPQAYIRDIRIRGNHVTIDKVIRRELAVYPGDLFDESRIRVSESRLRNLEYFRSVRSYPESTPEPEHYDLTFEVEEQRMGQLSLGAGFSSIDKISGFFEIAHGNFALNRWPPVGGGQKLRLRTTVGTKRQDVEISFVEPWLFDRRLSLEVDLFHHERRFLSDDYDQRNTGGSIGLTTPLGRFERLTLGYSLENYSVFNVSPGASDRIREEEGDRLKSAVSLTLSRDTRDRFFISTRGNRSSLTATVAGGPLMGDTDIYSLVLRTSQFWPLWYGHVFNIRGRIGTVDFYGDSDRVPIFDRFFLGGPQNLRGFRFRDVGPVDEENRPVGGLTEWFASAEYTIPVWQYLRLAGFYDMGYAFEDAFQLGEDHNSNIGLGVRFDIPMFPLRLDYAWPLETDAHNDRSSGRFSFMIGHVF